MGIHYHYKVYVPSLQRKVSFRDINVRDLININKSILNDNTDEIIECFDHIIEDCCHEKGLMFTLLDKAIILLNIRASSIGVFCKLTITDNEEQKEFEYTLELFPLIEAISHIDVDVRREFQSGDITIVYGVPLNPVQDVNDIKIQDYIHYIKHKDEILVDFRASKEDLLQIVENIDFEFYNVVKTYVADIHKEFNEKPLYVIPSPFNRARTLVSQKMTIDFGFYELVKMLFKENLHNMYRVLYNFNQSLNISPDVTERMVPVEKDLLWGYHLKEQRDAKNKEQSNTRGTPFTP